MHLEVFLAPHCITCDEVLRLVEAVRHGFATVEVRVHDLESDPAARRPEVFAVPTYLLDGRVLATGNPDERTLMAALSAAGGARGAPSAQPRAWRFRRTAAMGGGALAVLSCGGPHVALAVIALRQVFGLTALPAALVGAGGLLQSIADPAWALGLALLITGLARRGRCPLALAAGGCVLLHGSMLALPVAPGPLPTPDLTSMLLMLAGLAAIGIALRLGTARRPARISSG